MLKRPIKYEDFDGDTVIDEFYFNLSESELVEMQYGVDGGLQAQLENVIKTQNVKEIIAFFKRIVLQAYGEKSEDGKRFVKSDKLREEFSQTAAYNALFMELATNEGAAATFIQGILPKNLVTQLGAPPSSDETTAVDTAKSP